MGRRSVLIFGVCLLSCAGSRSDTPPDSWPWAPIADGVHREQARSTEGLTADQPRASDLAKPPDGPLKPPDGPLKPPDGPLKPPDGPLKVDLGGCANLGQGCATTACCAPLACSGTGTTCCKPVQQTCLSVAECCAGRACVLQKCCVIVGDGCSQDNQCCNSPAHQCQAGKCCVTASNGCSSGAQCCSGQCQLGKCT